jgi:hypothetical protein
MRFRALVRRMGAVACGVAIGAVADGAEARTFRTTTISNNGDSISEFRPRLAGDAVVWQAGSGAFSEVIRWDGAQRINLSANGVADENPETDGIHIVWQQATGGSHDIAVHDLLTQTTTILVAPGDEVRPAVSGTTLAWVTMSDADGELFIEPGPEFGQLTGNELVESNLIVDGLDMVFTQGDEILQTPGTGDDAHDVALWNGVTGELFIMASGPADDIRPSFANGIVVWQSGADGTGDIWMGDTQGTATPLYDGTDERSPHTDGTRVIWEHHDGDDLELYVVNLATPGAIVQLTTDDVDDVTPRVQGSRIVWSKQTTPGDSEIWVAWDGGLAEPVSQTTGNGRDDFAPLLDGDHFVYTSCVNLGQPSELCDVVLAPEPSTTTIVGTVLLVLATLASRAARCAVHS